MSDAAPREAARPGAAGPARRPLLSVAVQRDDFDTAAEIERLSALDPEIGAVVTFTGRVRGSAGGSSLEAMELEHYPGMTERALAAIAEDAAARWPLAGVRIIHRYGRLRPGERIVLVATASRHRGAAFAAAEFLMDYLKTRAPFWKKEHTAAGEARWVDARESDEAAARRWEGGEAGGGRQSD